jgi:hypothetical protein
MCALVGGANDPLYHAIHSGEEKKHPILFKLKFDERIYNLFFSIFIIIISV